MRSNCTCFSGSSSIKPDRVRGFCLAIFITPCNIISIYSIFGGNSTGQRRQNEKCSPPMSLIGSMGREHCRRNTSWCHPFSAGHNMLRPLPSAAGREPHPSPGPLHRRLSRPLCCEYSQQLSRSNWAHGRAAFQRELPCNSRFTVK